MNSNYCNDKPEEVDTNALRPAQSFSQEIGAEVVLSCVTGYIGKLENFLTVECREQTSEIGEWHTDNLCLGIIYTHELRRII